MYTEEWATERERERERRDDQVSKFSRSREAPCVIWVTRQSPRARENSMKCIGAGREIEVVWTTIKWERARTRQEKNKIEKMEREPKKEGRARRGLLERWKGLPHDCRITRLRPVRLVLSSWAYVYSCINLHVYIYIFINIYKHISSRKTESLRMDTNRYIIPSRTQLHLDILSDTSHLFLHRFSSASLS